MTDESLLHMLRERFHLEWDGIHGISHWLRVREIGLALAARNGADKQVVAAFAMIHDACRQSNSGDFEHGVRAAALAKELNEELLHLSPIGLKYLRFACAHHTDGTATDNVTIGTCWDADRLDLWRLGIEPDPGYLSTVAARDDEFRLWTSQFYRADSLLSICSAMEIELYRDQPVTYLIRIVNPGSGPARPDWFAGEYLQLEFGDVVSEADAAACNTTPPGLDDIKTAISFCRSAAELDEELLVSCDYGASRSTALALVLLADHLGPGKEKDAIKALLRIRPEAVPNSMVVRLGDRLLRRNGRLLSVLNELYNSIRLDDYLL